MPQIGPLEIMMVALIALLVFGPEKLPDMARSAGKTMQGVRRTMADVKRELKEGLRDESSPGPNGTDSAATGPTASTSGEVA